MNRIGGRGEIWGGQVRSVIETSLDAVITVDESGIVVDWNQTAADAFGWQPEEVLGREIVDFIIPEKFREAHRNGLVLYRKTGEAPVVGQRLELSALRRNGEEFPIELSVAKIQNRGVTYFLAYVRDITEWRRQADRQSREVLEARMVGESAVEVAKAESYEDSLQRILATLCEQIHWPLGHVWVPNDTGKRLVTSGIWYVGKNVDAKELRRATTRSLFAMGEGLPGKIWKSSAPYWLEDIDAASAFSRRSAALGDGFHCAFGFPVTSHDRIEAILEFFHTERQPRDEALLHIVGRIGRQIGELVHLRHYEHQQARLAAIVDSSYDAIIGKDLSGTITSWNAGAEFVYGYREDEALGESIAIILPSDRDTEEPEITQAIIAGQRLEQFKTTRRRKDGTLIPVSLTVSPIIDSFGRSVGSSNIERDISTPLRREEELRKAKQTADDANRTRGEFLANVSHELRTPMNAIIGMTEIALEEELSDEVRDYISTAGEAARSLLALLNDILDFSKLESGKFTITKEPFSLSEIVEETLNTVSPQAFAKGLELICELPRDLPRRLIGDGMRVRQVLSNLLTNAIKFTERGEVVLRVQTVRVWPNEVRLQFSVIDTGIGIPAEDQRRILEPFAQVDASTTREHGGTGLGLAISSELLQMMGGRLSLSSSPGEGSTFSFRLSFDLPANATQDIADGVPLEHFLGLPVLVVDDNETSRRIISEALTNWSMKPVVAKDAAQAIGIFERAVREGHTFPLVIVDALMPGMDGYELSISLANLSSDANAPLILMVSSTDRREFRDRESAASISVFLQKPVTQSDLMDAVMQALNVHPPERIGQAIESQSGTPPVPLSVLLAEDTPANQKVVSTVLKKRGHSVTVARNGREVVELYKRETFDVILMDVQMPILDGFQATAAVRELERQQDKSTPIIAMTAHAMRGDREKCLEAGMDAYIAKPLDVNQLLGLVESIAADQAGDNPAASPTEFGAEPPGAVIDYAGAMRRLGNDDELFREFVGFYDEDSKQLLAKIETAIKKSDAAQLQHAAHSLKGLAANLGASAVVESSFALERSGRSATLAEVESQLNDLRKKMARLDEALRQYRP